MAPPDRSRTHPWRRRSLWLAWSLVTGAALLFTVGAGSPASAALISATAASGVAATTSGRPVLAEPGDRWQDLSSAQKQFLQPLQRDWERLDLQQKRKWAMLTTRVPKMSADERQRIQTRMTEWATLTPEQRGQARMRYQEAKQVPARDRQARWDAYQSLSPEQKKQLAARASLPSDGVRRGGQANARGERSVRDQGMKSNIVPNPAFAAPPKAIGPTLVQATPGATTTLISKPATPPTHQQTGMPKIAATPEFVNKATLLPRRGPQGAATRSATAASSAEAAVRQ